MKSYIVAFVLAVVLASCSATYAVRERPADVTYNRPASPGIGYVWISGNWVWGGGRYNWHEGYWDRPRAGRRWEDGRWLSSNRGYRWQTGHWRRH